MTDVSKLYLHIKASWSSGRVLFICFPGPFWDLPSLRSLFTGPSRAIRLDGLTVSQSPWVKPIRTIAHLVQEIPSRLNPCPFSYAPKAMTHGRQTLTA